MNTTITANRGEWSELYVLLKILAEGKLFGSDDTLELKTDIVYSVLEVVTNYDTPKHINYQLNDDEIIIYNSVQKTSYQIKKSVVKKLVLILYSDILRGKGRSFSIANSHIILDTLKREKIKATSNQKNDLMIRFHDLLGNDPLTGFSIKSYIGGSPTLFNASGDNTNFVYELINFNGNMNSINSINSRGKYRDRVKKLYSNGVQMKFTGVKSADATFINNLDLFDDQIKFILAEMIKAYYSGNGRHISEISDFLIINNPMKLYFESFSPNYYKFKIKNFLLNSALGMTAAKPWKGTGEVNGGFIAAKHDGELACFPVRNFDELKEYLFKSTFFDTPSSGRHEFGVVEKINEKYYMTLNFQIRSSDSLSTNTP